MHPRSPVLCFAPRRLCAQRHHAQRRLLGEAAKRVFGERLPAVDKAAGSGGEDDTGPYAAMLKWFAEGNQVTISDEQPEAVLAYVVNTFAMNTAKVEIPGYEDTSDGPRSLWNMLRLTSKAGTAVKIMTGAPVPRGADAVVPFEQTNRGSASVDVHAAVANGANIRLAGSDVQARTAAA